MLSPELLTQLHALKWKRLRLTLRCTANREARRHPHFIVRAVLYCARSFAAHPLPNLRLHWRPVSDWWGERLHKDHRYRMDVFLPGASSAEIATFCENLAAHLADPKHGFSIESPVLVEDRSLATLEAETAALADFDAASEEVCLDFLTPLTFRRIDPRRPWLLTAPEFGRKFAYRMEQLGLPSPSIENLPWDNLQVIQCYWSDYNWSSNPPGKKLDRRVTESWKGEPVRGMRGPLYLRGGWQTFLPLLLLAEELQLETGDEARRGQGAFRLLTRRPFFDLALRNPNLFRDAWDDLFENDDVPDHFADELLDRDSECAALVQAIQAGSYEPGVAAGFTVEKKRTATGEDRRLIAELPTRDRIVQRALHTLMSPVCDRLLEHASVGYRPGRSVETARQLIRDAIQAGCTHALETDIAAFFDEIEWPQLEATLDRILPKGDTATRTVISKFIRQSLRLENQIIPRAKGVLQGSALSPLLANLYLDAFDEQITALGHHLVRYGDDLLILTQSEQAARDALDQVRALLLPLGLELKETKTAVTSIASGIRFLGFEVGPDLDTAHVADIALRQTLFIQPETAFLGLDYESLVVRRKQTLVARLPLYRLGCLILFGHHSISTGLLRACTQRRIPVVFCSAGGHYHSTLRPDSRRHFEIAARQFARHHALGDAGRLELARRVVAAKLTSYQQWLHDSRGVAARSLAAVLSDISGRLGEAPNVESLRGREGEAARRVFAHVQTLVALPEFASAARIPHEKRDRFNALMDFAYWLLFTRLNVLARGAGLSPYLGFLHSHKDHYESLVYDLMEPFRFRLDRLALNCLHLRSIRPEHFEQPAPDQPWRLTRPGMAVLVEAFEKDLATRRRGEPGTFRQLLVAQVNLVERWAVNDEEFRLYPLLETVKLKFARPAAFRKPPPGNAGPKSQEPVIPA